MKKWRFIMVVVFFSVLMTGCASVNYDIKVNDDLSANVSLKVLVDTTYVDMQDIRIKDELTKIQDEAVTNGYTVTPLKEGDQTGIVATKFVENIRNVSLSDVLGTQGAEDTKIFRTKKGILYDTYLLNIPYDGLMSNQSSNVIKGALSQIKVKFSLQTPTAIEQAENQKTMNWEFDPGSQNIINASFKVLNSNRIFIYSVLVIVLLGTIRFYRRQKSKKSQLFTPTYHE